MIAFVKVVTSLRVHAGFTPHPGNKGNNMVKRRVKNAVLARCQQQK